jgi:hypothetical protein
LHAILKQARRVTEWTEDLIYLAQEAERLPAPAEKLTTGKLWSPSTRTTLPRPTATVIVNLSHGRFLKPTDGEGACLHSTYFLL